MDMECIELLTGRESNRFHPGSHFQGDGGDVERGQGIVNEQFTRFRAQNNDVSLRMQIRAGQWLLEE